MELEYQFGVCGVFFGYMGFVTAELDLLGYDCCADGIVAEVMLAAKGLVCSSVCVQEGVKVSLEGLDDRGV